MIHFNKTRTIICKYIFMINTEKKIEFGERIIMLSNIENKVSFTRLKEKLFNACFVAGASFK